MQRAINALIDAAFSRFTTNEHRPVAPVSTFAESTEPQAATQAHDIPEPFEMTIYQQSILGSPLAVAPTPAAADLLDVIYRDESVQRAAGASFAKFQRLAESSGFTSQIHSAIDAVTRDGTDLTPAAVVEALRRRAEDIENALADIREDREAHQTARLKRTARHEPLRAAVSKRLDQLIAERTALLQADDAERRANRIGLRCSSRFAELRKAGLNDSDIAKILPGSATPEAVAEQRSKRIAHLAGDIAKLRVFCASTTFGAALLADFPEFSDLIAARDGALPEVA